MTSFGKTTLNMERNQIPEMGQEQMFGGVRDSVGMREPMQISMEHSWNVVKGQKRSSSLKMPRVCKMSDR